MSKRARLATMCLLPWVYLGCAGPSAEVGGEAAATAATGTASNAEAFDAYMARMRERGFTHARNETLSRSYRGSQRDNEEYQRLPPIKVFDNLYYVGPGYVAVWLVPTSEGLILFDAAEEPYVDLIVDNIRAAGFDPQDVEYILISHGHADHFAGAARLQELTGARVGALAEDWQLMEEAGVAEPDPGESPLRVPERDLVLEEGTDLTLGDTTLQVYHMPGHTPGSPSFEFTVYDNGTPHKAFLLGGPSHRDGVEGGQSFMATADRLLKEQQDVEVALHVHSWQSTYPYPGGGVFERAQRFKFRQAGDPHPFVDNTTWRVWLETVHAGAVKFLAEQQAAAAAPSGTE